MVEDSGMCERKTAAVKRKKSKSLQSVGTGQRNKGNKAKLA